MAIYPSRQVASPNSQSLPDRDWLSTNLQTVDEGFYYNPNHVLIDSPEDSSALLSFPKSLIHVYNANGVGVYTPFYRGLHFTIAEDIYDKVSYNAGVITDDLQLTVYVQNMSKVSQAVSSISITAVQGASLSGIAVSDVFNPYEEKELAVTLVKEGAATINAEVSITLSGDPNTYFFNLNAFRFQLPFMLDANWADGVTVSRSFQTSVFNSYGTGESRKILRKNPVRTLQAELSFLSNDAAVQAWQSIKARAKGPNIIPFYPDAQPMTQANDANKFYCDTQYRRYAEGGSVLAVRYNDDNSVEHYDVLRISSVESDGVNTETPIVNSYSDRDTICPAMACYPSFGSDAKSNITRARGTISLQAEEIYADTAIGLENASYVPDVSNGYPVFNFRINDVRPTDITVAMQGEISASGRGSMWYTQGDYTYTTQTVTCTALNREEYWERVGFFNYLKGRGKAFWIRAHSSTLTPFNTGTGFIEVSELDALDWEDIKYLWLTDSSGTVEVADVTSVTEVVGGFRIAFTASITPVAYDQALLVRLDSDEITENWFTNTLVEFSFDVKELQGG